MIEIDNNKMWEAIKKLLDVADAIKISLNKQGLQWNGKEIVSTEPKFKVGDWIVGANNVFKIIALNNELNCYIAITPNNEEAKIPYYFDDGPGHMCSYHLWTIQDAKDGDVLFHSDSASNGIFIFKELLKCGFSKEVICYCDYDSEDGFCLGDHHTCCWADAKILHPATKEQRDILFAKMKEEGYVWLSCKKRLVKLLFKEGDTVRKKLDGSIWHINYINEHGYWGNHKPLFPIEKQNEFELVEPELTPSEVTKENGELTEFEKAVNNLLWRNIEQPSKFQSKPIEFTKNEASELLSIARKQVIDEGESWLRCQLISKYRNGILQCLRDDRAAFILDDFRKALEKGVDL